MRVNPQIKKPAMRYFGGKWRLAPWVISHFPDCDTYVEPYGGAMSVLLRKEPSPIEVYNDLDDDVVNFFRVLRERPYELMNAIMLTPFARSEQRLSFQPAEDELERARRLYTRAQQTIGGPRTQWSSGWRKQIINNRMSPVWQDMAKIAHLWEIVDRLKMVQIENRPALEVIEVYDHPRALFYIDPPYNALTRADRWRHKGYKHEMTMEDHEELAKVLHQVQGDVILSGYEDEQYKAWYADWRLSKIPARSMQNIPTMECLWIKPGKNDRQTRFL